MLYRPAMRSIQTGAGISTDTEKIDARDPMGLDEFASYKWLGIGNGQIRT
jgi:gamma-glutamyl phosphate reductase